jgi:hypothetical protein
MRFIVLHFRSDAEGAATLRHQSEWQGMASGHNQDAGKQPSAGFDKVGGS